MGAFVAPSLPSFLVPSIIKFFELFPSFFPHNTLHEQHWHATSLPRWECLWFSFPPSGTCDLFDPCRRLSLLQACLISFSVAALCLSFRVSIHFILFFNLVYAGCPSSQIRFLRTRDSLGPWSATPGLILRRRPLTTVGRPSPTAVAESQWGEPRSDASGTSARVAGSLSQWLVLLPPSGQPLVLAVCGRSILTWHHCGCQVGEEEGGAGHPAVLISRLEAVERCSIPPPPPSPSDDLRPPLSYRLRGVAVG